MKRKLSLKNMLLEEESIGSESPVFNDADKRSFMEALKNFSRYKESIYRNDGLDKKISEIKNLIEIAEQMTIQETADWFDNITVSRHMKQLKEAYKSFEKTAGEIHSLQPRLVSSYEDIVEVLQKYYDVG